MNSDNLGGLWRNKRREKENHPTHTGSITVAGVDYWLSAWVKEKNGERFFSLAAKPKDAAAAPRAETKPAPGADNLDDEIPWG